MKGTIEALARRPRVKRDTCELRLLSQGNAERITDISIRRLGVGTNGRSAEVYAACMAALHPELVQRGKRS